MLKSKHILYLLIASLVVLSCSRKKDAWLNRTFHQGVSKFNPYFNGDEAYKKGRATVESSHKDDFEKILPAFKWGDDQIRQSVVPDMDRAVEKGTKVIQTHSMDIKGNQKNKYVIYSYMLIGKARFYKGDYFPALETFNFVINEFGRSKEGKEIALEANLWAAWCQLQIGNTISAENYLNKVYRNKDFDRKLKDDVAATLAQKNIQDKNWDEAYTNLREATATSNVKEDKIRWTFMMGQLQEIMGNKFEASSHFKKVVDLKPANYEMQFIAQLKRALNFDIYMEDPRIVYRELERMINDDKNYDLKDQIYYVMALISIEEEDFQSADKYLKQSVKTSTNNQAQKGISYTKMAEIAFMFKNYVNAQAYYDSAYTSLPPQHAKYAEVEIRKESLTELVENINTITYEDSIQKFANLSLGEQKKRIDDYIEWLKEEEERLAREKEIKELNATLESESQAQNAGPNVGPQSGWYFYNSGVRSNGLSSFKKVWGSRKWEDNWRQSKKATNYNKAQEQDENAPLDSASTAESKYGRDPVGQEKYDPEYYLSQIPSEPEDFDTSNARILRAYINLGRIYYELLDDWEESVKAYGKSVSRFPGNKYEPKTLYYMYRIFVNQKKAEEAEEIKKQLVEKYPNSVYAQLIGNPIRSGLKDEAYLEASAKYKPCFELYSQGKALSCQKEIKKILRENPNIALKAKFELLYELCYGKLNKEKQMVDGLKRIVAEYQGTPEAVLAQNLLDQMEGAVAQAQMINKSLYKENQKEKHRFIIITPAKGINMNEVRNAIADYNVKFHSLDNLQVNNIFLDADNQMLMVINLENKQKAEKYYKGILMDKKIMGYLPQSTATFFVIGESNFKTFYSNKVVGDYITFFNAVYNIN